MGLQQAFEVEILDEIRTFLGYDEIDSVNFEVVETAARRQALASPRELELPAELRSSTDATW